MAQCSATHDTVVATLPCGAPLSNGRSTCKTSPRSKEWSRCAPSPPHFQECRTLKNPCEDEFPWVCPLFSSLSLSVYPSKCLPIFQFIDLARWWERKRGGAKEKKEDRVVLACRTTLITALERPRRERRQAIHEKKRPKSRKENPEIHRHFSGELKGFCADYLRVFLLIFAFPGRWLRSCGAHCDFKSRDSTAIWNGCDCDFA